MGPVGQISWKNFKARSIKYMPAGSPPQAEILQAGHDYLPQSEFTSYQEGMVGQQIFNQFNRMFGLKSNV